VAESNPRLLFCSYHGLFDPTSGAALATRELLELLAARGWSCGVVCGPHRDAARPGPLADLLAGEGLPFDRRVGEYSGLRFDLYHTATRGVPVTVFVPVAPPTEPTSAEEAAFLDLFGRVCDRFGPDVLLTYGGHRLARRVMDEARRRRAKVVFALHNLLYTGADLFRHADAVFVPSAFALDHYRRLLGIQSTPLPGPLDWARAVCERVQPRFVTFVNPVPEKGVFWAARLIDHLARRRPDIPFLVVEGRGAVDWLGRCGVDLVGVRSIHRMQNTPDPRAFYAVSRAVLVPSLVRESFGRVAAEAVLNCIPVIASDRGALPEVLTRAGMVLPIPDRYTPQSRVPPTAEEVAPWAAAVERLWDDPGAYAGEQDRCRVAAEAWRPETLLPRFETFFRSAVAGTTPVPFCPPPG
jgi:glycosyltransferase involved in cell wall biosynthesis